MRYVNQAPAEWPKLVGVDFECTSLDPLLGRLLSVAVSDGKDVWIFLHTHNLKQPALLSLWQDDSITKLAHNAEFELSFLIQRLGLDIEGLYDTMLCEQLLNEGKDVPVGLVDVAARRCGVLLNKEVTEQFIGHPGFHIQPVTEEQLHYMEEDVLYLPAIYHQQQEEVSQSALGRALALELNFVPVVAHMRLSGLRLNTALWDEYLVAMKEHAEELRWKLVHAIGPDYKLVTHKVKEKKHTKKGVVVSVEQIEYDEEIPCTDLNWNSTKQMQRVFDDRFDIKTTTTDEEFLKTLMEETEIFDVEHFCSLLLNYRSWVKMQGWDYPKYIHPVTGKVHPQWRQLGAGTGRMSCAKPNMQNVPRPQPDEPNLRRLWIPDSEDYLILCADYSQQEPRVLAQLCRDPRLMRACNAEDVYIEFAQELYGHPVEKGSEERYRAKQFVLATFYGAGPDKLHLTSGMPLEECERIHALIRQTFPVALSWAKQQGRNLKTYGYTTTMLGRKRYAMTAFDKRYSVAVNSPVQGTSAEMLKLAAVKVHNYLTKNQIDGRIWLLVHDEMEVHVHQSIMEEVKPIILELMNQAGHELCPDVLHIAEGKVFPTWDK